MAHGIGTQMSKKPKAKKRGSVRKIIKPYHPSVPEKAEIMVHGADDLYREIRIENALQDEHGHKRKLKEGADVDVIVEADLSATVPDGTRGQTEADPAETTHQQPDGTQPRTGHRQSRTPHKT